MGSVQLGTKAVGSIVKLKENGALVEFYVATHDYESGLNGVGRTLLVRRYCYDQREWHSSNINAYASSTIDAWLNSTYKNLLDPDIRTAMGITKIYYTPGNGNTTKTTLQRSVFLLSATELGQARTCLNQEGTALSSTVLNLLKIAYLNGSACSQWTRSPVTDVKYNVWYMDSSGNLNYNYNNYYCTRTYGYLPAFTLPNSLYVNDDGTVTTNTAPTMPISITVPETIQGGSAITVQWAASTDAENNLEGYELERSTDGGSSWNNIYKGSALSTINTVPFGTGTVMYRVRAYDSEGLYSSYRTSAQQTVINNAAPGAPASITVPVEVLGGSSLTVAWGAAADQDGNLAGYALERQVDGGSWEEVYRGENLTYADAVTRGWESISYRVRAYDSYTAYSDYTTSPARQVNNNIAPVITSDTASGTDLGTKSAGFSVDYSASDADGDDVTVTEAIDGETVRTFAAEAGESYAFHVTSETWMKLVNGAHELTVSASDGQVTALHKLSFTKAVTSASITLAEPVEADAKITICVLSVSGDIPADATFSVKVTNNANDAAPVWEDCTMEVKTGANHIFTNEIAVSGFAFNFKVEVERGESGQGGYINSVQGGFQ